MKSSILRSGVALACAVSLASCGGGNTGTLYLSGYVSGITQAGLTLQNNGGSDLVIPAGTAASTQFVFKDLVPTDSIYNVTIKKDANGKEIYPPNVESCTVSGGSGNTGLYSVSSVLVTCVITTHELGGTVAGLGDATGLVLINGSNQVAVPANATTFQMAKVSLDYPYGITVLSQPAGKTCTVTNGVGTMSTTNITNVVVACTANAGT